MPGSNTVLTRLQVHIYENVKAVSRTDAMTSGLAGSLNNGSYVAGRFNGNNSLDYMLSGFSTANSSTISRLGDTVLCQSDAPEDLKVVSWPKTRRFSTNPRCYSFDARAGRHVVLYVVENGIANSLSSPVLVRSVVTLHLRHF